MDPTLSLHPTAHPRIVLDITRLLIRAKRATPSGIDRFELAYADWLAREGAKARFLVQWRSGALTVRPDAVSRFVARVRCRWIGAQDTTGDAAFAACIDFLEDRPHTPGKGAHKPADQRLVPHTAGLLRHLRAVGKEPARPFGAKPAIYLNIGHWHLERLGRLKTQFGAPGRLRVVATIHDLLPIETPEYFAAAGRLEAERRMASAAHHADALLFTSRAMQDSFIFHARRAGLPVPRTLVLPPGIDEVFSPATALSPIRPTRPYFVICGNIEARKNHLMLLNVWRAMTEADGARAPRLLVVGRRGWHAESVISALDRSPLMGRSVLEVSGLGTAGLAALLAGAHGLLMPSFAEGYGIPIAEARASGVPVICSDIPAHREVGGSEAIYLDPIDGIGWMREIRRLAQTPAPTPTRPGTTVRWPQHFSQLGTLLSELAATP